MSDLTSSVRAAEASTRLKELRETCPEVFESRGLFLAAHALLARYRVPLQMRKQIHALVSKAAAAFEPPDARRETLERMEHGAPTFGRARGQSFVGARVSVAL